MLKMFDFTLIAMLACALHLASCVPLVVSDRDSITSLRHLVERQSQQIQTLEAEVKQFKSNKDGR